MCECGWCVVWCPSVSCSGFEFQFALCFSTLNFSTFLFVISYAEQTIQ